MKDHSNRRTCFVLINSCSTHFPMILSTCTGRPILSNSHSQFSHIPPKFEESCALFPIGGKLQKGDKSTSILPAF